MADNVASFTVVEGSLRIRLGVVPSGPTRNSPEEREAAQVRAVRAQRDRKLTPTQRLERLHVLCRDLAEVRLVDRPR